MASERIYDPDHPDADWTGFVERRGKKCAANPHALRENVTRSEEHGITPTTDAAAVDNWCPGRRVNSAQKPQDSLVLGGPLTAEEERSHFRTAYQSATMHEPTPRELRSDNLQPSGRKHVAARTAADPTLVGHEQTFPAGRGGVFGAGSAAGRRPSGPPKGGQSLLAGLGADLLSSGGFPEPPTFERNDGSAADAARSRKELFSENYSSKIPGYTGRLR